MQTILITGSSSGIGQATAQYFHEQGWNVVATMREPAESDTVFVTRLDVQDPESITAAVEAGIERFGRIDVLLNNAGYGAYGILEATPIEKIRRQFDVNVIGLLETTKAVLPHFRANGAGTVINVSSIGGRVTFPLGTLYHGSKFAVEGLSEALHYELAGIGVRVKIVEPGFTRTDFAGRSFDFTNDESLTEYQKLVSEFMTSMNVDGDDPSVVAEVIYRAATDGTDQLRYPAGPYAAELLGQRAAADDATFLGGMRQRFGL
ncbi:SDR family oxidoreductase [Actinoplanes bogorensis]|uniref:SDR family oxidoreductase n=1 Tax=Paractinoplanes bogorensis TaxID=1610840 RepID=A0ABS5YPH0_9ACTN|nr:SDR family oxidoreductase [Actinoplanes bogorensis]MBU2665330.1 SDR family oxidoreductase [Actinoplanes bogorensis]